MVGLLVSGCGNVTAFGVAKGVGGIVLAETAKHEYVQECSPEGKFEADCRSEAETLEKLGRSIYSEVVDEEFDPIPENLP